MRMIARNTRWMMVREPKETKQAMAHSVLAQPPYLCLWTCYFSPGKLKASNERLRSVAKWWLHTVIGRKKNNNMSRQNTSHWSVWSGLTKHALRRKERQKTRHKQTWATLMLRVNVWQARNTNGCDMPLDWLAMLRWAKEWKRCKDRRQVPSERQWQTMMMHG